MALSAGGSSASFLLWGRVLALDDSERGLAESPVDGGVADLFPYTTVGDGATPSGGNAVQEEELVIKK